MSEHEAGMLQPRAFDVPGMRQLSWQKAPEAPQAVIQFFAPEAEQIELLRRRFSLHDLQLIDIRNPQHPARLIRLAKGHLLILRLPRLVDDGRLDLTSVSLLFDTKLCAIVWPDPAAGDALERRHLGGVDIHDTVCRAVHALTERLFTQLAPMLDTADELEDACFSDIGRADMASLLTVRQNLVMLSRAARNSFIALDPLLGTGSLAGNQYLVDACEHMQRAAARAEAAAEHLLAVMQAIQSLLGQRMNETVKLLTIITVILSPLAVITGIFGMNFVHMDILKQPWGFATSLLLMVAIAGALAAVFKWKRWW
jgi:Mg2+ and Co2+ transporter CorA